MASTKHRSVSNKTVQLLGIPLRRVIVDELQLATEAIRKVQFEN